MNKHDDAPIPTYTTAPVEFDGFGTRTTRENVAKDSRGRAIRLVETPRRHVTWQRTRYGSGLHLALPAEMFDGWVADGLITLAALPGLDAQGNVIKRPTADDLCRGCGQYRAMCECKLNRTPAGLEPVRTPDSCDRCGGVRDMKSTYANIRHTDECPLSGRNLL